MKNIRIIGVERRIILRKWGVGAEAPECIHVSSGVYIYHFVVYEYMMKSGDVGGGGGRGGGNPAPTDFFTQCRGALDLMPVHVAIGCRCGLWMKWDWLGVFCGLNNRFTIDSPSLPGEVGDAELWPCFDGEGGWGWFI